MMAAIRASQLGADVTVFERNEKAGRKLGITGKGRCNVTNNSPVNTHIANIPTNPKFMYSALNNFTPADTMEFFEALGVKLKTERGNRVFPVSDKASEIVGALKFAMNRQGVKQIHGRVKKIEQSGEHSFDISGDGFNKQDGFYSVIIATGGASYEQTGSSGDGYRFAEAFGHTLIPVKPSLVPVECREKFVKALMGLSLKNVKLTVLDRNEKEIYSEQGEMLFTHFGVSGPLVLSASSHMKEPEKCVLSIDLKPALTFEVLDRRIRGDFEKFANRDFINSLSELLPSKLIPVIASLSGIDERKKVNVITKEERHGLVNLLKDLRLTVTGFRPLSEAIITSGGVCVKEISPRTMESKIVSGLYFAGEVIDVDAYTGGFNLQIAFSTARLAAENAVL